MHLTTRLAGAALLLTALGDVPSVAAQTAPSPGPCEQAGAIGAIVDRPGLGRPTANNGSPCVVPLGELVIEAGYRDQQTSGPGGTSTLLVFPLPLVRIGLGKKWELAAQPPSQAIRSGAALGGVFVPAVGAEDEGFGVKRMLDDRPAFQDAAEFFVTVPTGKPQGPTGFSAGAPTYTLSYTAAVPLGRTLGLSITQNVGIAAAPLAPSGGTMFFSYQPSATLSVALPASFTLMITDQITTPASPWGGTGNRALFAVQRVVSPALVLDAEYELDALPSAPSTRQHAFGIGGAFAF